MADRDSYDWPVLRGDAATVGETFGEDIAGRLAAALNTGDPLADAVVDEQHEHGRTATTQFQLGLRGGLAALDDPLPALAAFLREAETITAAADDDLFDRASLAHFSVPGRVHAVGLGIGALLHLYQSPSIAKVLASTGRLLDAAGHRITQTARWQAHVTLPGSLRCGEDGYVQTLQVRLIHATMRRMVSREDYRAEDYGVAINQLDLARTWVDFARNTYLAEHELGYDYTAGELSDLYRYWRHIGLLLGVEAAWLSDIDSHESAARLLALTEAVTGPPVVETIKLADAALAAVTATVSEVFDLTPAAAPPTLRALAQRVLGEHQVRALGIEIEPAAEAGLSLAIATTRTRRSLQRRRSGAWQRLIDAQLSSTRELLAG